MNGEYTLLYPYTQSKNVSSPHSFYIMLKIFFICLLFISSVYLDEPIVQVVESVPQTPETVSQKVHEPVFKVMHVYAIAGLAPEYENTAGVISGPIQSDSGKSKYPVQMWTPTKGFETILVEPENIMHLVKSETVCKAATVDLKTAFNVIKDLAKGNTDNLLDRGEIETKAKAVGATVFQQYGEAGLVTVCEYERKYLRTLEHVFDRIGRFQA